MIKETSLNAYRNMGHGLGQQQNKILMFMMPGEPYTRLEISEYLQIPINAVCGRVNELMKEGLIEVRGKIQCPVSKNIVEAMVRIG